MEMRREGARAEVWQELGWRTSRLVPFFHWHHFRYRLHPQELRAVQNDAVRQLPAQARRRTHGLLYAVSRQEKERREERQRKRARETMAKARKAKTTPKRLSTSQGSGLLCKAWDPHAEGLLVEREKQEREGRRICGVNRPLEPADALIPGNDSSLSSSSPSIPASATRNI